MCGIWAFINLLKNHSLNTEQLYQDFMKLQSRGPDLSSFQIYKNNSVNFLKK